MDKTLHRSPNLLLAGACCWLMVVAAQHSALAATFTWTGNGGTPNWSAGGNWDAGVPTAGSTLVFPVTTHPSANNDFPVGTAFDSIQIVGTGYTISGNAVKLNALNATNATGTNTLSCDIQATNLTINCSAAGATLSLQAISMTTVVFNAAGSITVNGFINGGGFGIIAVTKDGAGTLTLKSPASPTLMSAWLGSTEIKAGKLQLGSSDQIPDRSTLIVDAGANFDMADFSESVGAISGAGSITRAGVPNSIKLFTTGTNNESTTFSGVIADSGKFQKTGAGTCVLSGNSTMNGLVVVEQGALYVNGSFPTAFSSRSTGLLAGTGTVGDFSNGGGSIGGGTATASGAFTVASMDMSSGGGTLSVRVNGNTDFDQVKVSGAVNLTSGVLKITAGGGARAGDTYTVLKNNGGAAITGAFTGLPEGTRFTQAGNTFIITYAGGSGRDVVLTNGSGTASGVVTDQNGTGVPGVTISNGGSSTTTAADGTYALSIPDGPVTLTPSKPGFVFNPPSINVNGSGVAIPGQNFSSTQLVVTISGTVKDSQGKGAAGVTVSDGTRTATTGTDGAYTINNVPFGSYTLTPSKSTLQFNPATRSVDVTTADPVTGQDFAILPVTNGSADDTDGDGFPNDVELAAGTDPFDPTSTPFSGQPAGTPVSLNIKALQIRLAFSTGNKDAITMSGTLAVPSGFVPTGQQVIVVVGGVIKVFSLDAKGMSTPKGTSSFKLAKANKKTGLATYTLKLASGSFASSLAKMGLDGTADAKNAPVNMPVTVYFNVTTFQTLRAMKYTAKKGKTGSAK